MDIATQVSWNHSSSSWLMSSQGWGLPSLFTCPLAQCHPTACWNIDFTLIHKGMPWATQRLSGLLQVSPRDSDCRICAVRLLTRPFGCTARNRIPSATLLFLDTDLGGVACFPYWSICCRDDITTKELICLVSRVTFNCRGQLRIINDCFLLYSMSVPHFFSKTAEPGNQFP